MMHAYPNPHPQRPMQQYQQPAQQFNPQQQQAQILQQQVTAAMAQAGFQLMQQPQTGQMYFQNTLNGQCVGFEQAVQQFVGGMMQQRPQLPQQQFQPMGGFQQPAPQAIPGRYTASSAPPATYPSGSVQAANQRPSDASQTGGMFPTELGNRFGQPAQPAQVVNTPPVNTSSKEKPVAKQEPVSSNDTWYYSAKLAKTEVTASSLSVITQSNVTLMNQTDDSGEENVIIGSSTIRESFATEQANVLETKYKPIHRFDAIRITEFVINDKAEKQKIEELLTMTEARSTFKTMANVSNTRMSPECKAALIGIDRNMTEHVNDCLCVLLGRDTQIESFFDDFNALSKLLRDKTETCEDDLLDILKEMLTERSKDLQQKTVVSISDRVELVYVGVLASDIGFDDKGNHSKAFNDKLTMIAEKVTRAVFYIQTLDKVIFKVYDRSVAGEKEFIVQPYTE